MRDGAASWSGQVACGCDAVREAQADWAQQLGLDSELIDAPCCIISLLLYDLGFAARGKEACGLVMRAAAWGRAALGLIDVDAAMGNGRSATASGWVYGDLDGKLTAWLGSKDAAEGRFGDGVGGFDAGWLGLGFCREEVPDLVLHRFCLWMDG
ncbi:hypothetical protein M0R45_026319 [Rubus argutus]|uniref:Uncharacterized protein n=1 Tax=Rubus argutus TaxID=59490 RepID=A0AAW1WX87_RUBAR